MMQFWGLEVKNGGTVKVQPGEDKLLHISQACLGEVKKDKGNDCVRLFAQKNGQKYVIGVLSADKFPHRALDLIFESEFELSHDGKQSVHFAGYEVEQPVEESSGEDESDDSDEDEKELVPVDALNNGIAEANESKPPGAKAKAGSVKPENAEDKPKVKIVEPNKDSEDEDDDDEFEEDEESDEDDESDEDEDMPNATKVGSDDEDDSDEEDESDEEGESDEETPQKKPEPSKKRPGESTSKTPAEKKAKFSTPEKKTDGKKVSGHVATPHPAKQAAKTPANAGTSNKQTPKAGSVTCSSCSRLFGSQQALDSHSKAKHSSK